MNDLDRIASLQPSSRPRSEATAIEQSRAIAEVQAMVVVAQQCPRDIDTAMAAMRDTCGRLAFAERAFYAVKNRGQGPSVHLARELARVWGNIEFGVHELRRDDTEGISEVQAFAWDKQANSRSSRTFIVPHQRMVKGARVNLVDLTDVYLNNQNVGARAVRETIFSVLPTWFTEEAQQLCRQTMEAGGGEPLETRVANMLGRFDALGVTAAMIEARTSRKQKDWTPADLADLSTVYASMTREGIDRDEFFPTQPVTAAEILGGSGAE